jgi:hypothetical protein
MRIAAIAATLFLALNLAAGRYWWALAFGVLAAIWFVTGRAIDGRERGRAQPRDGKPPQP